MKTVWVVTKEVNAYDQFGDYFEGVWANKPTYNQVEKFLISARVIYPEGPTEGKRFHIEHLLAGGGRKDSEDVWYNLQEIELQ